MSRPSSSLSTHRAPHSSTTVPANPMTTSTTTVPFTPRPKHQSRDHRNKEQDLLRVAEALASVRKDDPGRIRRELEEGGSGSAGRVVDPDRSFHLEESTFRTRPLVPRVSSSGIALPMTTATSTTTKRSSSSTSAAAGMRNVSSTSTVTADKYADRADRLVGTTDRVRTGTSDGRRQASSSSSSAAHAAGVRSSHASNINGPSTQAINPSTDSNLSNAEPNALPSRHSRPTSRASERHAAPSHHASHPPSLALDKGKQRERVVHLPDSDDDAEEGAGYGIRTNGNGLGGGRGMDGAEGAERRLLVGVPLVVQEAWVCEDLRFVLQGVQGELIRFAPTYDPLSETSRLRGAQWQIDPSLDPSLTRLVEKILPLATFYTAVSAFVDLRNEMGFGMVCHALASGIRGVLRDYHILTAKLESLYLTSPDFTLQSAFQHLHPTLHVLSLLYALCLSLDHDPFPEFDDSSSGSGSGNEDDEDDEDKIRMAFAKQLGLDVGRLGGMGQKEREKEAARGNIMGGEVLGVIMERAAATSGDPSAHSLYSSMLLHASQPYARILIKWITTGTLKDPYDEFLIKEDSRIDKGQLVNDYSDEYWERRYTLRDGSSMAAAGKSYADGPMQAFVPASRPGTNRLPGGACIPPFLEAWKFKILLAGKYLNVIKECGVEIADWEQEDRKVAEQSEGALVRMDQPKFYQRIETAYFHSNKTLLDLILREKELVPNLRSMKHFFFLDQSEFLNQFFDNANLELKKLSSLSSMTKIQSLLYMAVSNPASASSLDPHKEQLRVVMASTPLYDWLLKVVSKKAGEGLLAAMKGSSDSKAEELKKKERDITTIDALAFDFDVKFPLSLVISRKAITRYQLISRFLLGMRYLEFSLGNAWTEHKTSLWRKSTGAPDMESWKRRIFVLRAMMLQWVQHMLGFVTGDVLETRWKKLEEKLSKVSTIDQLLRDHVDYLDTCLKECTLTSDKLITVTSKIVATITTFNNHQATFSRILTNFVTESETVERRRERWALLQKFEDHFKHHLATHLDTVTYMASSETPVLMALVARLTPLWDRDSY